jgi:hypothetical protein
MQKPRGAPTKYIPEYDEAVRGLALLGATDEEIAEAFDISTTTLNAWKTRYPTFLVALRGGKVLADAQVAGSLYARAIGYEHEAVKIFLPPGAEEPVIVPYIKRYAPDTNAARFWLMNRQRDLWKEKQQVAVADPLASMSPEARLAQVVEIMAKARALLDAPDAQGDEDEITDAELAEVEG